jgi:predicted DsbA family dithiol-disulfide isomerase
MRRKSQIISVRSLLSKAKNNVRRIVLISIPLAFAVVVVFTSHRDAASASVTITEFSDFQCPYCKKAANVVERLRQSYGDKVKFVLKQMPLSMHRQAFKAAQASVCAGEQGKFWEYYDRLFASSDLSVDALNQVAAQVGLQQNEFGQCLESDESRMAVKRDMTEADRLGVNGTPTFFVNGRVVRGEVSFAALKSRIDQEMVRYNHTSASTVTQPQLPDNRTPSIVDSTNDISPTQSVPQPDKKQMNAFSSQAQCASFPAPSVAVCSAAEGGFSSDILSVFPANPSLQVSCSAQFSVLLTTSPVQQCDFTSRIQQWTSSNPTVASIDATGNVSGLSLGSTTITATEVLASGPVQASTTLTVVASPPPTPTPTPTPSPTPTPVPAPAVSLSPTAIDFGYQLVGNTSPQFAETVTNSGTAPLVITDISVAGRDRRDFTPTYSFTLPVTVAPGGSIAINLYFTATAPWRAGTRNARLEVDTNVGSKYVNLAGIGATCGGPLPGCSSGCADSDGDGLNDAWEIAGGIDVNNDGVVDATHDLLLPGADPNKPDIYVQYDWMDYGLNDIPCNRDSECTSQPGLGHAGETCTGPPTPYTAKSCVQACVVDSDCTALGPSHIGDKCVQNMCEHTHDPEILAPGALQAVADAFTAHGFNLHILRGRALPHSHVVSFRNPEANCEGANVSPGTLGGYAVNLYDLKNLSFDQAKARAFHYSVFGHYSGCDNDTHCDRPTTVGTCPTVKGSRPQIGQTGQAEISGNDFTVSLGHLVSDLGRKPSRMIIAGTFMHELGHNFGLHHGGGTSAPGTPCTGADCEDLPLFKPNYLSVMNYRYQTSGILEGDAIGSSTFRTCSTDADCSPSTGARCEHFGSGGICLRLDYSNQVLPTGGDTPGVLTENGQLNEPAGLGSGRSDLFTFDDGNCSFQFGVATEGSVDWDGNGVADNPNATADLNTQDHAAVACTFTNQVLRGHTDWGPAPGQSIFTMAFQCTPNGLADGASFTQQLAQNAQGEQNDQVAVSELTPEMAMQAHVLYPPRPVQIEITPGCPDKTLSPGRRGEFSVALLGSDDLDVREIETPSLRFHGASSVRTELSDINGDGKLDLVVVFEMAGVRLNPQAKTARLTGWLKNSQAFIGEDRIEIVP